MQLEDFFPYTVDPNSISVYIGRVIKLDDDFSSNGILYIDLVDPEGTDLDKGAKTSNKAIATFSVRNLYRCWENPPEIKSKTQFDGSMSFTSSGDFHLRNYCFDMHTLEWILQVSTLLNILFPVTPNVPPIFVGLDTTPFPGQAVSVNVSVAAKEVVNEAIQSSIKDLGSGTASVNYSIPTIDEVKEALGIQSSSLRNLNVRSRFLGSSNISYDGNDPVIKVIYSILSPINNILDIAIAPYYEFIKCIDLLLEIYSDRLKDISDITFPITQFSTINEDGTATTPSSLDILAIKNSLQNKINKFSEIVPSKIEEKKNQIPDSVLESIYNPIIGLYMMVETKIQDIVSPIKNKVVELIGNYVKDPLSHLTGIISMAIQPMVSSLPTIIQLIVKLAIKKLLQLLLGTPIKLILETAIAPITELIDRAVQAIENGVSQIICTSINTLINPIIGEMQKSLMSMIPDFGMQDLESKLRSIRYEGTPFPKIFVETDPVKPYKDFDEINWSDPAEIKAMIVSLIEDVGHSGEPTIPNESKPKVLQESIYLPNGEIQGSDQNSKSQVDVKTGNDPNEIIGKDAPLKEGTIDIDGNKKELYYKKFSSKEEFLPFFEKVHNPIMIEAVIGEVNTIFYEVDPKEWITNNVGYIDVEDNGKKVRYVCYYVGLDKTVGVQNVVCADGKTHTLEKNRVYYSTTIPHVKKNANDPPVGEDLVPVVEENGNLKSVFVPKTWDGLNEQEFPDRKIGEALYRDINGDELTFMELADKYYRVKEDVIIDNDSLVKDVMNHLNNSCTLESFKNTNLYNCLTNANNHFSSLIKTTINNSQDEEEIVREAVTNLSNITEDAQINIPQSLPETGSVSIIINNPIVIDIINSPSLPSGIKVEMGFSVEDSKLKSCISFSVKSLIKDGNIIKWPEEDNATLTCITKKPDTSSDLYCWMTSSLTEEDIDPRTLQNPDASHDQLADMTTHTITAIGQEDGFDADVLVDVVSGKATSVFTKIVDAMSEIGSLLSSSLERVNDLKNVGSLIDKIAEIGDRVKEVSKTVQPALEATAKAAAIASIQSCSMSQSASGKDFSFTSGMNYDLSTTTYSRSQLPYCKELGREKFLEPNCKVLALAVGAGKQNLYVVDILT